MLTDQQAEQMARQIIRLGDLRAKNDRLFAKTDQDLLADLTGAKDRIGADDVERALLRLLEEGLLEIGEVAAATVYLLKDYDWPLQEETIKPLLKHLADHPDAPDRWIQETLDLVVSSRREVATWRRMYMKRARKRRRLTVRTGHC